MTLAVTFPGKSCMACWLQTGKQLKQPTHSIGSISFSFTEIAPALQLFMHWLQRLHEVPFILNLDCLNF